MASRTGKEFAALEVLTAANLNKLAEGWIGYASNSADQTGISGTSDITGATITVTAGTARLYLVLATVTVTTSASGLVWNGTILEDSTVIGRWARTTGMGANAIQQFTGFALATPTAGSHTYKLQITLSSGTGTLDVSGTAPAQAKIVVVDLGPAN